MRPKIAGEGEMRPFRVDVPDEVLNDLHARLKRTRWADDFANESWQYGTNTAYLKELVAYWIEGYDWRKHFEKFPFTDKTTGKEGQISHGVNTGMALKQPGVWFRQSNDPGDRAAVFQALKTLDKYHGQATGMFTCDEHLAGRNPSQGTELCTVVECHHHSVRLIRYVYHRCTHAQVHIGRKVVV